MSDGVDIRHLSRVIYSLEEFRWFAMPRKRGARLKEDYEADVKRYLELVKNEELEHDIPPKRKQPRPAKQAAPKRPKYRKSTTPVTKQELDNNTPVDSQRDATESPAQPSLIHNQKLTCPGTVATHDAATFEKYVSQTATYETMIAKIVEHVDDIDVALHHCLVEKNLDRERQQWTIPTSLYDACALEVPQQISLGAELDEIDSFWDSIK
ncbi:hypothetical protein DIURU_000505 [Diutina rugosa]|uniref:Uncharacterized protein n=1 Tax=Diutina rugosa TaxID=5481 RepID=A0A642UXX4_DIURU|nr:uncharacterized protein DIURU_000505 [Diutina rugosa]KAA8907579.1 hypothetical protein DIURU_000505 [Diutina rugosa]